MKIKTKILLMFSLTFVGLALTGIFVYKATTDVQRFQDTSDVHQSQLLQITGFRGQVRSLLFKVLNHHATKLRGGISADFNIEKERLEVYKRLDSLFSVATPSQVPLIRELDQQDIEVLRTKFADISDALKLLDAVDETGIEAKINHVQKVIQSEFEAEFLPAVDHLVQEIEMGSKFESVELDAKLLQLKTSITVAVVLNLALLFVISLHLISSIGGRLSELERATTRLSVGNFDIVVSTDGKDEISSLAKSFSHMAKSLSLAKEDIVRKQDLLAKASKMAALGQMSAGVAHEINNPLAIIKGHGEKILTRAEKNDLETAVAEKSSRIIVNTTNRIARIVQSLRQTTQLMDSQGMAPYRLDELIQTSIEVWQERFKEAGAHIIFEKHDTSSEIFVRKADIVQAMSNLINNSLDAISEKSVTTRLLKIDALLKNDSIEIRFTDSGPGIPREHRDKIMQPFFTLKEVGKGTGLGLSAAQGIIAAHGGELFLDESVQATCFVVRLPSTQAITLAA